MESNPRVHHLKERFPAEVLVNDEHVLRVFVDPFQLQQALVLDRPHYKDLIMHSLLQLRTLLEIVDLVYLNRVLGLILLLHASVNPRQDFLAQLVLLEETC